MSRVPSQRQLFLLCIKLPIYVISYPFCLPHYKHEVLFNCHEWHEIIGTQAYRDTGTAGLNSLDLTAEGHFLSLFIDCHCMAPCTKDRQWYCGCMRVIMSVSVRGGVHIVFPVLHVMPHCIGFPTKEVASWVAWCQCVGSMSVAVGSLSLHMRVSVCL